VEDFEVQKPVLFQGFRISGRCWITAPQFSEDDPTDTLAGLAGTLVIPGAEVSDIL